MTTPSRVTEEIDFNFTSPEGLVRFLTTADEKVLQHYVDKRIERSFGLFEALCIYADDALIKRLAPWFEKTAIFDQLSRRSKLKFLRAMEKHEEAEQLIEQIHAENLLIPLKIIEIRGHTRSHFSAAFRSLSDDLWSSIAQLNKPEKLDASDILILRRNLELLDMQLCMAERLNTPSALQLALKELADLQARMAAETAAGS